MMNFDEAQEAFDDPMTWERLANLTPLNLSQPENKEILKRVLDVVQNGVCPNVNAPVAVAHFAEIYERKHYITFDSFTEEHRNDSYNDQENIVVQVTYVLNKHEHGEAFSKVKAEGENLKGKITTENKADQRAALEAQLAAAKEARAQAEAQLKAL